MSNALSVSAVTATLRNLLDTATRDSPGGTVVTSRPPDKARGTLAGNQLNLFLYHVTLDAAWRNMPVPGPVRSVADGLPALPLCLYYLITAYGENDEDAQGHKVLGRAMSALHDRPVLAGDEIRAALGAELVDHDLHLQREGLRITYQPLSLEEMSKLWTTFQTQYRVSAAYQVSVVLVDSERVARAVLPVLRQGPADTGPDVTGGLDLPFATLDSVAVPDPTGAAAPGDTIRLTGHRLAAPAGGTVAVRFTHPLLDPPHELPAAAGATDRALDVVLPGDAAGAAALPSGAYGVQVVLRDGSGERTSDSRTLALGSKIIDIAPHGPLTPDANGAVRLTVTFTPHARPEQRVRLLVGDRELAPQPPPPPPAQPVPGVLGVRPARRGGRGARRPASRRRFRQPRTGSGRPATAVRSRRHDHDLVSDGTAAWERRNEEYLAAGVAWVRLLLERAGGAARRPLPIASVVAEPARRRWFAADAPVSAPRALPAPDDTGGIAAAARAMEAAAATDPPPALRVLADRFGLTPFEHDLLLLCIAVELQPGLAALCAAAQGDPRLNHPTFALAFVLFDDPTWEPLLPDRPLRRLDLVEIHQPLPTPLTAAALRADEHVVSFAKGISYLDDRLAPLLERLADDGSVPGGLRGAVDDVLAAFAETDGGPPPAVQIVAADPATAEPVAVAAGRELGLELYRLPVDLVPADPVELDRFARLWERQGLLAPRPVALYVDGVAADARTAPLARLVARTPGPVLLTAQDVLTVPGRAVVVVEVAAATAAEQEAAWRAGLGGAAGAAALADQFHLPIPTIHRIARTARHPGSGTAATRARALCLAETRRGLDGLADRVEAKAGWDDIVLPEPELRLVRLIADQVAHRRHVYEHWGFAARTSRGLGINALFCGPSGTGKTMAAEVISRHLDLHLCCIDLSRTVSKYIGETEKHLARIFDEAEHRGVVLFFDECDALFGKRTEVRDSHDRYANIESSYLLQRIEAFSGLAILATNMKSSLDPAFVRRLRFVVDFKHPGPCERTRIWEKVFPAATETEGLDPGRLGRLNLTGGNIFTIAMNAAFLAAAQGTPVRMEHVLDAARLETRKLERPVNERDFVLDEAAVR